MKILITSATSAAAHKLKAQLAGGNEILLGDFNDLPAFMLNNGLVKLPNPASASYAHEMLTYALDKDIAAIYSLTNDELALLKQSEQLFNEYNISIVNGKAQL